MLTNKIFNASALRKPALRDLCFLANISLLTSKRIFAFYQMYVCLLSNIFPFYIYASLFRILSNSPQISSSVS